MKATISVPTSLNEITVEQYQRFDRISKEANKDFIARKMLEIFCGVTDTLKVKKSSVDKVYDTLNKAFNERLPLITRFTLDGTEFGFIPNLEDITLGEYIDLDNLLSWENMHRALAVLYRPVTKSHKNLYQIEEYETSLKYADVMLKAPAGVALGATLFFWTLSNDLPPAILTSSKKQETGTTAHDHSSTLSTVGSRLSKRLRQETSRNKRQLPDYLQANAFLHYLTILRKEG